MSKDKTANDADARNVLSLPSSISIVRATWQGALVKLLSRTALLAAVAYLCVYVVREMTESNPEIDEPRKEVARLGISQMVADIRSNTADESGPKRIAVMHFANDPSDFVTETVRKAVGDQGGFQVVKSPLADRFCKMVGRVNDGVSSREQAIRETHGDGLDGVLWGRVNRLENERDGATFTGDYELYDLRLGRVGYSGKIRQSTVPGRFAADQGGKQASGNYARAAVPSAVPANVHDSVSDAVPESMSDSVSAKASGVPWHIRFLLFVVAVLLLPVVTISFIRTMVSKKSNGVNAFVLGVYTTVDLILAFFMVGGRLSSFFAVAVFLLSGGLAFLYNVKLMTFAVRLEE